MNKAERKELDKAVALVAAHPDLAAASMAVMHRAARNTSDARFIESLVILYGLRDRMEVVNGCYVAKQAEVTA